MLEKRLMAAIVERIAAEALCQALVNGTYGIEKDRAQNPLLGFLAVRGNP